ncbi:Neutral ceramidase precursor [Polystyrenella longa]|uniref:Neutral ceramidase n=1 Tax=Polystyrenella longa TaxID=2528007 RepID=A0A518CU98_9PLAN|nr:neutral/alkaline non-lysosomal ceramidase N-terminal domain-containing protein [Polystyrenella longa]QDU82797.1 Neutral ceramidase precursor [Polystyrenella longa]
MKSLRFVRPFPISTVSFSSATLFSLALLPALFLANAALAADAAPLKVGAYAMDITPENFPISSAGSLRARMVKGVHDPLHARCLVVDNGSTAVAFAVCDHCMIPREIMDEAKSRIEKTVGIPAKNILISATHTHTGVTVTPVFEAEVDEPYCDFLTDKIVEGIAEAWERRQPAQVGYGSGHDATQVFNRRWFTTTEYTNPFGVTTDKAKMNPGGNIDALINPAGPIDPEIAFLSAQTPDGKPISVLANYSLHYVGGIPGGLLSADYYGEYATRLAGMLGADGEFVGIMSNGTSGDINNINFRLGSTPRREPFEQIQIVAGSVASATKTAYEEVEYHSALPIDVRETEIELGVRKPTKEEVAQAKAYIASQEDSYKAIEGVYANETVYLADFPDSVKVKLQAIRIGDLAIVSTPCETFAETGIAIKDQSPFKQTFVMELANGYNGYLPTPKQHEWGGYETWRARSSYLATDAEPKIRTALLGLLNDLAEEK